MSPNPLGSRMDGPDSSGGGTARAGSIIWSKTLGRLSLKRGSSTIALKRFDAFWRDESWWIYASTDSRTIRTLLSFGSSTATGCACVSARSLSTMAPGAPSRNLCGSSHLTGRFSPSTLLGKRCGTRCVPPCRRVGKVEGVTG